MKRLPTTAALLAALSCGPASAEALADDPMAAPAAGKLGPGVDTGSANMVGEWSGEGMTYAAGGAGITGIGYATRDTGVKIDFAAEAEWFFRVTIERESAGQGGSDYSTMVFFTKDSSVENRPITAGVSSGDTFLLNLAKDARADFGQAKANTPYVIACRLATHPDKPDKLDVWVWEAGKPAPDAPPSEPDASVEADYGGSTGTIRLQTGNAPHATATFRDFRLATSWESLSAEAPEIEDPAALHTFRDFEHLRVEPDGLHLLPVQWAPFSVLPNGRDASGRAKAPDLLIDGGSEWVPHRSALYTPVGDARRAAATPEPNPDLPLYDGGDPDHGLPSGRFFAVDDGEGGWDLFDLGRLQLAGHAAADGTRTFFEKPRNLELTPAEPGADRATTVKALRNRAYLSLADADGDGVVDLLIGRQTDTDEQRKRWPGEQSAWTLEPQPLLGPHTDTENTEGFRGYDVAGNWLGTEMTKQLNWCRGSREGDTIRFGPETPVYLGRDDYPVQWRNDDKDMRATVLARNGQRHVILISDVDQVLALPVLDDPDAEPGTLTVGKAVKLLGDNPAGAMLLPDVQGVFDVNGDGLDELLLGNGASGRSNVYGGSTVGDFELLGPLECVGGVVYADTLTVPAVGDWDGDGIRDLMLGDASGHHSWFMGTSDPKTFGGQRFVSDETGETRRYVGHRNLQGAQERGWSYTQPELFDWDADGTLDLITNDNTSTPRLLRRTDPSDARLTSQETFTMGGSKLGVAWRHRATGLDGSAGVAGDDRPVLVYLNLDLNLVAGVPVSTGSTEIEREVPLLYTDGSNIRTSGSAGMSGRTVLNADDWDGDGVWDVVFGVVSKNVEVFNPDPMDQATTAGLGSSSAFWLKNVGTAAEPEFEKARRITWKDGGVTRVETHGFAIEPTDLDGDGKLDVVFGDGPGFVYAIDRNDLTWE